MALKEKLDNAKKAIEELGPAVEQEEQDLAERQGVVDEAKFLLGKAAPQPDAAAVAPQPANAVAQPPIQAQPPADEKKEQPSLLGMIEKSLWK